MLEIGGQWVSPDQDALIETIAELGLETYSRYREGDSRLHRTDGGELTRFTGEIFPVPPRPSRDDHRLIEQARRAGRRDRPRPAVGAPRRRGRSTAISFEAWLDDADRRRGGARQHRAVHRRRDAHQARARVLARCRRCSWRRSAGSFSHLVDADFILDKRVVGGLQQVPLLLAERLGDDVLPRPAGAHAASRVATDGRARARRPTT